MDIARFLPDNEYQAAINSPTPATLANPFVTVADLPAAATTLYTGDGSLAGNRVVTAGANSLTFTGGNIAFNTSNLGFTVDSIGTISFQTSGPGGIDLITTGAVRPIDITATGIFTLTAPTILFKDGSEGTIGHVWTSNAITGQGSWAALPTDTDTNIYNSNGSIPVATTRTVTIADNSVITFTAPTFGTIFSMDGASGKVTIPGLLDPIGLQMTIVAANPGNANTLWSNSTDSDRPYWGAANKIAYISDVTSIYGANGTIGTGRVATLTDTLEFSKTTTKLQINNPTAANGFSVFDIEVPNGSGTWQSFYENKVGGASNGDLNSLNFYFNDSNGARTLGGGIAARVNGAPTPGDVNMDITINGMFKAQFNNRILITPGATTAAPIAHLEVRGIVGVTTNTNLLSKANGTGFGNFIFIGQDSTGDNVFLFDAAGKAVFNDGQQTTGDLVSKGATDANLFLVDASSDRVGVGTVAASITSKLTVSGGDIEVIDQTKGVILKDRTSGTRYRVYIDSTGTLFTEAA